MKHEVDLKSKPIHTDLAIELTESQTRKEEDGIKITDITLDKNQAKHIGKKAGTYITIEFDDITDTDNKNKVKEIFTNELKKLIINSYDKVLVIGLGNEKSTPDSLGPLTISKIVVTNHLYLYGQLDEKFRRVSAIEPGVTGQTGIETSDYIKSIVKSHKPDLVIVVDALAAQSSNRVNKTIQITNSGINPGSGIGNKRKEISKDTLNVPILAIGVPTVVDAASIVSDTIQYLYSHFAYQKESFNKPKTKLTFNVNYLKYNSKIEKDDKKNLLGLIGTLNEDETKQLIYEILNPIGYNMMVTPKEEDFIIEKLSDIISEGINDALQR